MIILAIDPGPSQSAWLSFDTQPERIRSFGILANDALLAMIHATSFVEHERIVIEQIEGMGMAVGKETFETVFWSGRFAEAARPVPFDRVTRRAVKLALCGSMKAKDPNIRTALLDRYGPGKELAVGTKSKPGPLYRVANDVWSALAVAVTYADQLRAAA